MKPRYKTRIEDYCKANSIVVPGGFGRNTPARYVLVRTDIAPPKIVATTWSKQEDVVYYIRKFIVGEIGEEKAMQLDILDFDSGRRLRFNGTAALTSVDIFIKEPRAEQWAELTSDPGRKSD